MFSPNRIDLDDTADLQLWADNLGITVDLLRDVVARVGPMAPAVRFYVTKSAGEKKPVARTAAPQRAPQKARAGAATPPTLFPSMTTYTLRP